MSNIVSVLTHLGPRQVPCVAECPTQLSARQKGVADLPLTDYTSFCAKNAGLLWHDLAKINQFVEKHFISIAGQAFFCVLRDNQDGLTKVQALSRPPGWVALA